MSDTPPSSRTAHVTPTRTAGPFHTLLILILTLSSIAPIWVGPYFPSQNGPWFLLTTHMLTHYWDSTYNYSNYYVIPWHPIPHMLHEIIMSMASLCLPLLLAEKVALTINALLLPSSIYYFLRVSNQNNTWPGYLAFTMILSYPFFRGYHDYTLSVSLYFLTLAYWSSHHNKTSSIKIPLLWLLSVFVYLAHLKTFALLAFSIGWINFYLKRDWKLAAKEALLTTSPGWFLVLDFLSLNTQSNWVNRHDTTWLNPIQASEYFFTQFFYSVSLPAFYASILPWLALGLLILGMCRKTNVTIPKIIASVVNHPLASLSTFLILLYFIMPYKMLGWHKVNIRLIPFILGLLIVSMASSPQLNVSRAVRNGFGILVAICTLLQSACMTHEVLQMNRAITQYNEGIDHFLPNSTLLPIHNDNPAFGFIRPLTRAHEYYHIAKGGANGHGIAQMNTLSMMWYRTYPTDKMFPVYRPGDTTSLQAISERYDFVLVMGMTDAILADLHAAGFVVVFSNQLITLLRNQRI